MIKILIPRADGIYSIAADAFSEMWKAVTGSLLEIITADDGASDLVSLGSDASSAFTHGKIIEGVLPQFRLAVGTDAYALRSVKDSNGRRLLFIAGARPRALLYGVYAFFELQANCRYFWDGDIIPKAKDISLDGLDVMEAPRFMYRGLRYFAHRSLDRFQAEHWDFTQWRRELDWLIKKRMNLFMLRIGLDDLFQKAFPEIVHYPKGYEIPEAKPRSYDDRTLFWSMEQRGELRKQILQYAKDRDLLHPEDLGTMTHWYSRTPLEYLDKVKPDFMPQATSSYSDKTGLVWDIRQDKNLDAYFQLTETHIREYGSPNMFHTIGLAERKCYEDRASNQQMKLYTYRRIQAKLREKYPNAPLLIGTWDFCMYWTAEEVRELVKELNPENTLIFDYTSDTDDESRTFQTWDLCGRFPWIYGIFHAYEPENELRGNYYAIEKRLPLAAKDSLCQGMVYWPENSHSDTLMLDFLAENAWNPSSENVHIESFVASFCKRRYLEKDRAQMLRFWREMLPCIKARHWTGPGIRPEDQTVAIYGNQAYLMINPIVWKMPRVYFTRAEYRLSILTPVIRQLPALLRSMAEIPLKNAHPFVKRDMLDMLKCAADRMLLYAIFTIALQIEKWLGGEDNGEDILRNMGLLRQLELINTDILSATDENSLYASLKALQAKHETNPDFEMTLKGNASCSYCRAAIVELYKGLYIHELDAWTAAWRKEIQDNTRRRPELDVKALLKPIEDKFYDTPLASLAPDVDKAFEDLPANIERLASTLEKLS